MQKYKISGYVKIGFEKIVECESLEAAKQRADLIERVRAVYDDDMDGWIYEVAIEEVEEVDE